MKRERKRLWQTFEEWRKEGIKRKYETRNQNSLANSKKSNDRSWYYAGENHGWKSRFKFATKRLHYQTYREWKTEGIQEGYQEGGPTRLEKSRSKKDRSWYAKGRREGWIKKFPFSYEDNPWPTHASWRSFGVSQGYQEINPGALVSGFDKAARNWYTKGTREDWIKGFKFKNRKKIRKSSRFENFEGWKEYGIERGYEERTIKGLQDSSKEIDRKWYHEGRRKEWLKEFPFQSRPAIRSPEGIAKFLKTHADAAQVAALSTVTQNVSDIAIVLMKMYPKRFPSATELAKSLPGAVKGIGASLRPFTMEKAKDAYENLYYALPTPARHSLDEVLYSILFEQYQTPFNRDPEAILEELEEETRDKSPLKGLASKVYGAYKDAYEFEIPGHGSLAEVA